MVWMGEKDLTCVYNNCHPIGFTRANIPKAQRRGAIIILGMLAKAKTEIVSEKVDLVLRIGLGPYGKVV